MLYKPKEVGDQYCYTNTNIKNKKLTCEFNEVVSLSICAEIASAVLEKVLTGPDWPILVPLSSTVLLILPLNNPKFTIVQIFKYI